MINFSDRISTGRQALPQRNVIYGVEGIGKTEFAAQFPESLFIAAERGTGHIDTARIEPTNWEDIISIFSELYNNPDHGFRTINIDTIGWVEEMCIDFLIRNDKTATTLEECFGGYGKWKRGLTDEFKKILDWCSALYTQGVNINLIGHASIIKFKNPEDFDYDRYTLDMVNAHLSDMVRRWSDNTLFMNYDTRIEEVKDGMQKTKQAKSMNKRYAYCQRTAAFDAKERHGLPPRFDLGNSAEEGYAAFDGYYQAWLAGNPPQQPTTPPLAAIPTA